MHTRNIYICMQSGVCADGFSLKENDTRYCSGVDLRLRTKKLNLRFPFICL